ncbi:scaffold attachment factor B2-like [Diorhabda carinulata]|uniref:scaffold attachment factor B2-like n=1 Tax=Diorhabda carinulata TaxID=1163345 RepID=UPI0025A0165B|nr:scaffold attachment factor B2-like [Diorhabda carinulata]
MAMSLSDLKVTGLKAELKNRELETFGKKIELVERLVSEGSDPEIDLFKDESPTLISSNSADMDEISSRLSDLKVTGLKAELKNRKLETFGKKIELVERLVSEGSDLEIDLFKDESPTLISSNSADMDEKISTRLSDLKVTGLKAELENRKLETFGKKIEFVERLVSEGSDLETDLFKDESPTLISSNFTDMDEKISTRLSDLKVTGLKAELENRKLETFGKKIELVERLVSEGSDLKTDLFKDESPTLISSNSADMDEKISTMKDDMSNFRNDVLSLKTDVAENVEKRFDFFQSSATSSRNLNFYSFSPTL